MAGTICRLYMLFWVVATLPLPPTLLHAQITPPGNVITTPNGAGNSIQQVPAGYGASGFQVYSTTPTIDDIGDLQNVASLNSSGLSTTAAIQVQGLPNGETLVYQPYNNNSTGTSPYLLACFDGTGAVQTCGASATGGIAGVVYGESGGAGNIGYATIGIIGTIGCLVDSGGATAGHWAIASATAGDCSDSGSTSYPTSSQSVGYFSSSIVGAGLAMVTIVQVPALPLASTINPGFKTITTATNCSSGASPAVCGSAASGSVAVPTGANSTLQVNTTAVTANSVILLTGDETLGTKLSVTCNSTLATAAFPLVVTSRSAGASFTITVSGTSATNPVCLNYVVIN